MSRRQVVHRFVGQVLLAAIQETAGAAWKPVYTAAWTEAYQTVQEVMLSGVQKRLSVE